MATPAAMPALDNTLGSMLIGVTISAVLYGVSLLQTFYYFLRYPRDIWYMKALVISVTLFDSVHMILVSHTIYYYLVTNYFNPASLATMIWSLLLEALFTSLSGAFVQLFYTARVWRLSKKNIPLTFMIGLLVLGSTGCTFAWVILAMQFGTFEKLLTISSLTVTINALSTATDIIIAVVLVILLHNARTGFKKSDTIINRLILFIVNTGVLTSFCAIASLVAVLASPNTLIYASFYFCIGRLYTNSLLATLNARRSLTGSTDDGSHMMVSLPPTVTPSVSGAESRIGGKASAPNISIRIDTTKEAHDQRILGLESFSHREEEYVNDKNHAI